VSGEPESERPLLKLVRGNATEEEIAALVAVLAAAGRQREQRHRQPLSEWSAHHRKVRVTLPHGRGGWRSSGLPPRP